MNNYLILRSQNSPYNDVTKSSVLSFAEMDENLIFLKGLAIHTATTNNGIVTLTKFNGEDIEFSTGAGTPFFLQNSQTTDAGSDKDAVIQRRGSIFVGDYIPSAGTGSFSFMGKQQFAIRHTGYTYINQESYQNSPNESGSLGFYRQRGTPQASLNLLKNDVLGTIKFTTTAYGISGGSQWDNWIGVYANENHGGVTFGSSGGTRMDFYLTPNGTIPAKKALSIIGSGDTQIFGNLTASTVSATTYYNLPINTDIFTTGGTYSNGTTTFTNNTGGTFNVSGYFKTSDDIYTTGMTFNASNYNLTISRNDNTSFSQNLSILASDMTITGGTYNANNGVATFTNNTGGTFNVSGFLTGMTDTFVTGGTYSSGTATFTNNSGGTFNVSGFTNGGSGPISVINTSSLFSTGLVDTGYQASGVTDSNFFGNYAGYQASGVSLSNFMGLSAGTFATNAEQSNFFGFRSGYGATDANSSNFLGSSAGYGATNASQSNFFGVNSGLFASGATVSNFFGTNAGYQAYDAAGSNFIGPSAGFQASGANNSNFIGYLVGYKATNAIRANFIGFNTGYQASGANNSNFFGTTAGGQAYNASNSNFLGQGAGYQASGANNSNFFGQAAGQQAYNAYQSNFIGYNSGYQASGALASIFIGGSSGYQASGAGESNFFGWYAGYKAYSAGFSTFIGSSAGREANGATFANFMGRAAGLGATGATNSNFIGYNSGYQATGASQSNFMGYSAGQQATDAKFSNFIGYQAGNGASSASFSNFMGSATGFRATGATNSNLFGYNVGYATITSDSIGSNNIIIGTNITLSAGTIDSINIGGVLFGTGTYSITGGNASLTVVPGGKIGIGVIAPTERLHVSGNLLVDGNLTFTGQSRNPIYSAGTVTATHIPNWNNSNIQTVILSAATTSISGGTNIQNGAVYTMILKQNASGSRVVNWGSEYKWQSGIAPVLSSTANAVDIITLISDGTSLYGLIAKDFR
jgi:hypothetical protein